MKILILQEILHVIFFLVIFIYYQKIFCFAGFPSSKFAFSCRRRQDGRKKAGRPPLRAVRVFGRMPWIFQEIAI
jgi:hypothetical protein